MAERQITGGGVQALIARIRDQGVAAGQEEADRLLTDAKHKAEKLIRDAEAEVASLKQQTAKQLEADSNAALEGLKLAARDAGLELQAAVVAAFERQVRRLVPDTTIDTRLLQSMVLVLAGHSVEEFIKDKNIRILASSLVFAEQSDPEAIVQANQATLSFASDMLREGVELIPADDIDGGVRVQVVDDNLEIDLTSGAIARLLLRHMLPRFRNLLSGAE